MPIRYSLSGVDESSFERAEKWCILGAWEFFIGVWELEKTVSRLVRDATLSLEHISLPRVPSRPL